VRFLLLQFKLFAPAQHQSTTNTFWKAVMLIFGFKTCSFIPIQFWSISSFLFQQMIWLWIILIQYCNHQVKIIFWSISHFNFQVLLIILNLVLIGITTSMFLKHLNAILKNFASGMFSFFQSTIKIKLFIKGYPSYVIVYAYVHYFIKTFLYRLNSCFLCKICWKLSKLWSYFSRQLHLWSSSRWLSIYKLQYQSFLYGFHFTFTQLIHCETKILSKKTYKAKKNISSKMMLRINDILNEITALN